MVNDGPTEVTSAVRLPVEFVSGKTSTFNHGGTGRPVTGKLAPPADHTDQVLWNFTMLNLKAGIEMPMPEEAPANIRNSPEEQKAWWDDWIATEKGKLWLVAYQEYQRITDATPYIKATVDRDGSFRIDDVPPGDYFLKLSEHRGSPGLLPDVKFTVPTVEEGETAKPVELGTLTLE